jgi:hypothetical protein
MHKKILIVAAFTYLSACSSGFELCCGYETRQDFTSDVSIVKNDGDVIFQNVSAIFETGESYIIETRTIERDADILQYNNCNYAYIVKKNGTIAYLHNSESLNFAKSRNRYTNNTVLKTRNSCLSN